MKTLIIFLFASAMISAVSCTCWDDWSRCTGWSMAFNGILWQKCPQRCQCSGYATGNCRDVLNTCSLLPSSVLIGQCRCSGTLSGPKPSWCGV